MNYVQRTEINQWRTLSFFSLPEDPSLKSSHTVSWKRHKRTRMGNMKTLVFRGCSRTDPKSRHDSILVKIIVNDCYSTLFDTLKLARFRFSPIDPCDLLLTVRNRTFVGCWTKDRGSDSGVYYNLIVESERGRRTFIRFNIKHRLNWIVILVYC